MKKYSKVCTLIVAFFTIVSLQAFAADVAPENAAVFSSSNVLMNGSSSVNGNMIIGSGELSLVGSPTVTNGVVYLGNGVTVPNPLAKVPTEQYDRQINEYGTYSSVSVPTQDAFSTNAYSDGSKNLEIAYWVGSATDKQENNYVLTENAYINSLIIPNGLTVYIDAPENTTRIIRVKDLNVNGNIKINGNGSVIIYADSISQLSNSALNVNGSPDKFSLVQSGDIDLAANFTMCGSIISGGNITVGSNSKLNGNLYAANKFIVSGGCDITGLVYAPNSDTELGGSGKIKGQLITKTLSMSGAFLITYGAVSPLPDTTLDFVSGNVTPSAPSVDTDDDVDYGDDPSADTLNVIEYDLVNDTYTHGMMNVNLKYCVNENDSNKVVTYNTLMEDTFVPDGKAVTTALKSDITEIADKTAAVFENRKGKIVENRFGRIDSKAYKYNLTVSPYVVPSLSNENSHEIWLVLGNRAGDVEKVWMSVK